MSESAAGKTRTLVLEDGTTFTGRAFGGAGEVAGEVVFATGMSGYIETLTDPSYRGQIIVLTYPLEGNYGVPSRAAMRDRSPLAAPEPFESARIQAQGLIVLRAAKHPSHHAAQDSLSDWLASEGVPGLEGVDTRAITLRLREQGVMRGALLDGTLPTRADGLDVATASASIARAQAVPMAEVARLVAPAGVSLLEGGPTRIMLVDCGAKTSIARAMLRRGASVLRVSPQDDWSKYIGQVDGVLLSNGPGDPKDVPEAIEQIRKVVMPSGKAIFGVCLGNQLLALAAGGDTTKLKYGHRSQNQPVQDLLTRRSYVTSQNHGYVVREDSLPAEFAPWFVNINDGSNEGIRSVRAPWSSVQFHPEASPGPEDAAFLFDDFLRLVGALKASQPQPQPFDPKIARISVDLT